MTDFIGWSIAFIFFVSIPAIFVMTIMFVIWVLLKQFGKKPKIGKDMWF